MNRPLLLRRAIASVCAQTHRDWRLIVVHETAETTEIASILAGVNPPPPARLEALAFDSKADMIAPLNRGLEAASGAAYVTVLDDDDTWEPGFLAACIDRLADPACAHEAGVITLVNAIEERIEGASVVRVASLPYQSPARRRLLLWDLLAQDASPPIHSVVLRRSVLAEIGGFDEAVESLADWDLYIRVAARFDIGVIPMALANYHYRPEERGADGNAVRMRADRNRMLETALLNQSLRRDLTAGVAGYGVMLHLARELRDLRAAIDAMNGKVDRLAEKLRPWRRWRRKIRAWLARGKE